MFVRFLPFVLVLVPIPAVAGTFEFKDGDRVVLIGATMIEREQRYGYWEAALTAANPDKNITFRNLGWSGDSVWGEARAGFGSVAEGYKQLIDHVKAEKPTVIIVGYGTNESFAGEAGLPKFKEQLKKLLDDLAVTKARLVFLSPMKMRKMPPPLPDPAKANEHLQLYAQAIREEADRRKATFINLMGNWSDPLGTIEPSPEVTDNGLHLTQTGYAHSAGVFARSSAFVMRIDARTNRVETAIGGKIDIDPKKLRFKITAEMLPYASRHISGSEVIGGRLFQIQSLAAGNYSLTVDGMIARMASAEEWAKGIDVFGKSEMEQNQNLRQTIIAKNELYFHRWRPANVTYLFGFRKHEQGNNAVEIPQFDPLIAEKEKEIAKLRKPVEHVYELVPVTK